MREEKEKKHKVRQEKKKKKNRVTETPNEVRPQTSVTCVE